VTTVAVTGGAGFIGSALVRQLLDEPDTRVVVVDKMTYAANPAFLTEFAVKPHCEVVRADIADEAAMDAMFRDFDPDTVLHLAAESHVDRSIDAPEAFVQSNIVGTYRLLQACRRHLAGRAGGSNSDFRFVHVSTDEVFGSLGRTGRFDADSSYAPNSPYAASKAAGDHLARAWHHTYDVPVIVTNCSNNYGPYQFPEKLIPLMLIKALNGEPMPVYGTGDNVRDWLFVEDHASALRLIVRRGRVGGTYTISGECEQTNLQMVKRLCALLDELLPDSPHRPHDGLIRFVEDRPGHDKRYALDGSVLRRELGWAPQEDIDSGLRKTVMWYLDNRDWWQAILAGRYGGERLGTGAPGAT
jgi:dTDP-glucose 4,6-dehydratase